MNNLSMSRKIIKLIYNSNLGKFIWHIFVKFINNSYVKYILTKGLGSQIEPRHPTNYVVFPKISKSISKNNLLIVMPFHGLNAVAKNIDTKINILKRMGFVIHVVIYNNSSYDDSVENADFTYNIKTKNKNFGRCAINVNKEICIDGNGIDDWIDDEICQFIGSLCALNKFKIVIVNYVFLSGLLEYVNAGAIKIIDTHDIFANRNSRMAKIGVPSSKYYFSTSEALEIEGLSRADYIFAIQKNEGEYFSKRVKSKVVVQPPTLMQNFIEYYPQKDEEIIVGFIGSAHYPNISAIENFISIIKSLKHNIKIKIAGQICYEISSGDYPSFVELVGAPDNLLMFYKSCDLMINPDMLYSGLKVKSLEALSYGLPLVSTKMAIDGIETECFYHQFDEPIDLAHYVVKISKKDLYSMAMDSRSVFMDFSKKYNFEVQIMKMMNHDKE